MMRGIGRSFGWQEGLIKTAPQVQYIALRIMISKIYQWAKRRCGHVLIGLPDFVGQRAWNPSQASTCQSLLSGAEPEAAFGALHVWTAEGWLYVAAVIDLISRRVVGWSMKAEMTAALVIDALVMAIWRRGKPDALLHHSDQGSQYTSQHFQELLAENGVTCSMSQSGNVWDNAAMESFFSSLKTERIRGKIYRTRDAARADVFDYIERFYNTIRRHSTIGYLSPVEFEKKVGLA